MKPSKFFLIACSALALSGCKTVVDDFMYDLNNVVENASFTEPTTPAPNFNAPVEDRCPKIEIVDELSSFSDFNGSMRDNNLISRVNLSQVESSCSIQRKQVAIDLKLAFNGELGPRAKMKSSDKPFFSYPFFVAVTNQNGVILAKEVFAASMTYERNEQTHTYFESLRQLIPISNADHARRFRVMIGFQLTEDQLAYNRRNMASISQSNMPRYNEQTKAALQNIQSATSQ